MSKESRYQYKFTQIHAHNKVVTVKSDEPTYIYRMGDEEYLIIYSLWIDEVLDRSEVSLVGNEAWERYPRHQIETGAQVVQRLIDGYPSITHVVGHCDVSPGRKIDPGYAFPWGKFENLVNRPAILFSSGF